MKYYSIPSQPETQQPVGKLSITISEEEGHRTAGLRTFTLIGLMGGIFGALSQGGNLVLLAAGFVTVGGAVGAFMWREGQQKMI